MPYGPLITREYGPNPKGSKLTIQEMDDNLLYLSSSIAPFPYTGSAIIDGSLEITGSIVVSSEITTEGGINCSGPVNGVSLGIGTGDPEPSNSNLVLGGSLSSNTYGEYNIAIGGGTLKDNSTGTNNITLGADALTINTSGSYNVAIGTNTLASNTEGGHNVALGENALSANTTGSSNTAIGSNVQSGDFSGSIILGAYATATDNGQLVLGSNTYPIDGISNETLTSNKTLRILLNGEIYKILLYKV